MKEPESRSLPPATGVSTDRLARYSSAAPALCSFEIRIGVPLASVRTRVPSPSPSSKPCAAFRANSTVVGPLREEPSIRNAPPGRPSQARSPEAASVSLVPSSVLRTTLAITVLPCMSMPGALPRITSMRRIDEAGMRCRMSWRGSSLAAGRTPSISTLPAAPPKPRTCPPPSKMKPGNKVTMSMALLGDAAAKNDAG